MCRRKIRHKLNNKSSTTRWLLMPFKCDCWSFVCSVATYPGVVLYPCAATQEGGILEIPGREPNIRMFQSTMSLLVVFLYYGLSFYFMLYVMSVGPCVDSRKSWAFFVLHRSTRSMSFSWLNNFLFRTDCRFLFYYQWCCGNGLFYTEAFLKLRYGRVLGPSIFIFVCTTFLIKFNEHLISIADSSFKEILLFLPIDSK